MGVQCSESDEAARRVFLILYVPAVSKARIPLGEEGRGRGEGKVRDACGIKLGCGRVHSIHATSKPI